MRKIKEILRLWLLAGLPYRQIARAAGVARSTVAEYIKQAEKLKLDWQQIEGLSEIELEEKFLSAENAILKRSPKALPEWQQIYEELKEHRSLTLMLLWQEYRQQHPDGYSYSQFHFHYSRWKKKLGLVMRQQHRAGEKLFLDYCEGPRIITESGESRTQIFVAVWGASNYTFASASTAQDLPSWIKAHVSAFEYFGCVPQILVPDNLKAAVNRACRYEPDLNPTYQDLAFHYGTAVIPARPRKPRDKAKVEAGVLLVQRWILAALRKRTFYSVHELNTAISGLLEHLNNRPMRKIGKSRRQQFETLDRPAALPLPGTVYEYATWRKGTVALDYHVPAEGHHYSVPYNLIGESVDIRLSSNTVEVFLKGNRVASHLRSAEKGGTTTLPSHMSRSHREHARLNLETIRAWAEATGPATGELFERIWKKHNGAPSALQAFRGIYRLGSQAGRERLELASGRAITYGSCSYTSIKRILSAGLEKHTPNKKGSPQTLPDHENIRGSLYYKENKVYVE